MHRVWLSRLVLHVTRLCKFCRAPILREQGGLWVVSRSDFRGYDRWPTLCPGNDTGAPLHYPMRVDEVLRELVMML